MLILWLVTGASLVTSLVALLGVRRVSKRLTEVSHLYWELRYQQGELRTHMRALGGPAPGAGPSGGADVPARPSVDAFVPLSSVRR